MVGTKNTPVTINLSTRCNVALSNNCEIIESFFTKNNINLTKICSEEKDYALSLYSVNLDKSAPLYMYFYKDSGSSNYINYDIELIWEKPEINKSTCDPDNGDYKKYSIINTEGKAKEWKPGSIYSFDKKDGIVVGPSVMWKRCPEGLNGINCEVGELREFTWDEAVSKFFNSNSFASYNNWRLPNSFELYTLVQCSGGVIHGTLAKSCEELGKYEVPTIDKIVFPNMPNSNLNYWASDKNESVSFLNGSMNRNHKGRAAVRLVRDIE